MIRSRIKIWWEILVRPTWKWLVLIPLAVLGLFQSVRDEFFSSDVQEKYKLFKLIPHFPVSYYLIIMLILILMIALESAYRSIVERDLQLNKLFDECAYSLQLVSVDAEDRRGKTKDGQTISHQVRFLLLLRNTLDRPIKYHVSRLKVNGVRQQTPLKSGGVIAAHGETGYYSQFLDLQVEDIGKIYNAVLEVEIIYGLPSVALTRNIHKKMHIECVGDQCSMLYEIDTEEPLGNNTIRN